MSDWSKIESRCQKMIQRQASWASGVLSYRFESNRRKLGSGVDGEGGRMGGWIDESERGCRDGGVVMAEEEERIYNWENAVCRVASGR